MKNRIITTSIVLMFILFTGCTTEELLEPVADNNSTTDVYYVLEQEGDSFIWSKIAREHNKKVISRPGPSTEQVFTRGAYIPQGHPYVNLTWSGFCDGTGVHGTAEIELIAPTFSFHFVMNSCSIVGSGNEAVFEGTIVQIISKTGNAPEFDLYWRFCFDVIDVQSAVGGEYDQISRKMMFGSPRSMLMCSVYPPGHWIWTRTGYNDVKPPGFVEVSQHPEWAE